MDMMNKQAKPWIAHLSCFLYVFMHLSMFKL